MTLLYDASSIAMTDYNFQQFHQTQTIKRKDIITFTKLKLVNIKEEGDHNLQQLHQTQFVCHLAKPSSFSPREEKPKRQPWIRSQVPLWFLMCVFFFIREIGGSGNLQTPIACRQRNSFNISIPLSSSSPTFTSGAIIFL